MTAERNLDALRERRDALVARLDMMVMGSASPEQAALREEIVALFREVEAGIDELSEMRESIRPLVDRYRALFRPGDGIRPPRADAPRPSEPRVVRVDHLGSSTYSERGWNAIAGGDYERAERELRKALELAPGNVRARSLLGWALMRSGDLTGASGLLEGVLSDDPHCDLARANLGYVRLREERFAEAIELLSRAARSTTDRTASLYANLYLGMVYARREMYRDACGFFQIAMEMGPNLIEAYWEMGRACLRDGSRDRALEVWRLGAERNRFNPWADRCRGDADRLEAGEALSSD
jgi:tetratricopeptide (TPR) repeat protein